MESIKNRPDIFKIMVKLTLVSRVQDYTYEVALKYTLKSDQKYLKTLEYMTNAELNMEKDKLYKKIQKINLDFLKKKESSKLD